MKLLQSRLKSIFYLGIFALLFLSCGKSTKNENQIVIQVGKTKISLKTFRTYYELDAAFPGYKKGLEGLKEYAEFIVDRELAGRLAERDRLYEKNPLFKKQINYARQKAIIRAFYRKEVASKIQISEDELREVYRKSHIKMQVKQIFTRDSTLARSIYQELKNSRSFTDIFEKIKSDKSDNLSADDFGEVSWGDLPPELETTIFQLPINQFSSPIKSRWGYHILFVKDRVSDSFLTEDDYLTRKQSLYKKLKRRKEEIAAAEYLKRFLDPYNIKVKTPAFSQIARILKIPLEAGIRSTAFQKRFITDQQIDLSFTLLKDNLDEPFMTSSRIQWTIRDFLDKLKMMPVPARPSINSLSEFKKDIGIMIRNDFLLTRAMSEHLDKSAQVDSTVKEFAGNIAYQYYLQKTFRETTLPVEVREYYQIREKGNQPLPSVPESVLPGMDSEVNYKLYYASRQLHRELLENFTDTPVTINLDLLKSEVNRINWNRPIRLFVVEK